MPSGHGSPSSSPSSSLSSSSSSSLSRVSATFAYVRYILAGRRARKENARASDVKVSSARTAEQRYNSTVNESRISSRPRSRFAPEIQRAFLSFCSSSFPRARTDGAFAGCASARGSRLAIRYERPSSGKSAPQILRGPEFLPLASYRTARERGVYATRG